MNASRPSGGTPSLWTRAEKGLWPTATATDSRASGSRCKGEDTKGHPGTTLTDAAVRQWRTPSANLGTRGGPQDPEVREAQGHSVTLADQVSTWPTPAAANWRSGNVNDSTFERNARPLQEVAVRFSPTDGPPDQTTETVGPPGAMGLNPEFVEALMGLPARWSVPRCGSMRSATASSLSRPPQLSLFAGSDSLEVLGE